jgi:hypothetical protein
MSGFPNRPTRASFGPRPVNRRVVRSAQHELGDKIGDLMLYTLGAAGVCLDIAWASWKKSEQPGGVWANGPVVLHGAGETWDPDGTFAPLVERTGAGLFTITYPETVLDKDGQSVALNFRAAKAYAARDSGFASATATWTSRIITMKTWVSDTSVGDPDWCGVDIK